MRISDWSSDVCSSDLCAINRFEHAFVGVPPALRREGGHAEEDTHQLAPLAQLVVDVTPFLALLAQLRQEARRLGRSEEHTSALQSLMRISYAVFCLKKKKQLQTK